MNSSRVPPALNLWLEMGGLLADAAEAGVKRVRQLARDRRGRSYHTRKPGAETPMWNLCAALLRGELRTPGAKARLARYLGVPRQRLYDFLNGRSRLPDAELTLRMLHWLVHQRAGQDLPA